MVECRFCQASIRERDPFCKNCGYDPTTDRINPDFKSKHAPGTPIKMKGKKGRFAEQEGISPGVKRFALIGLAILVFSIFYKYNFDIGIVFSEAKFYATKIMTGRLFTNKGKKSKYEPIEWLDMRAYDQGGDFEVDAGPWGIDGISFDTKGGKSFVVLNGNVVPEGAEFLGVKIDTIHQNAIEVIINGERMVFKVGEEIPSPQ